MTKPSIELIGGDELRRALRKFDDGLRDLRKVNEDAAEVVAERARSNAPRRSGRLASSIRAKATNTTGLVEAGVGLAYGGVIHFGWPAHNISPQPFLYDALDERTQQVVEVYEQRVDDLITKYGLA